MNSTSGLLCLFLLTYFTQRTIKKREFCLNRRLDRLQCHTTGHALTSRGLQSPRSLVSVHSILLGCPSRTPIIDFSFSPKPYRAARSQPFPLRVTSEWDILIGLSASAYPHSKGYGCPETYQCVSSLRSQDKADRSSWSAPDTRGARLEQIRQRRCRRLPKKDTEELLREGSCDLEENVCAIPIAYPREHGLSAIS